MNTHPTPMRQWSGFATGCYDTRGLINCGEVEGVSVNTPYFDIPGITCLKPPSGINAPLDSWPPTSVNFANENIFIDETNTILVNENTT